MKIIDPGHIYRINKPSARLLIFKRQTLTFVKRSGEAVTYKKEWPGIQTQAVMRAIIDHIKDYVNGYFLPRHYGLWQLGSEESQPLIIGNCRHMIKIIDVCIDRSEYLNNIITCVETVDACCWMELAKESINDGDFEHALHEMRMALWCYEARAYRRKQEHVNRKRPTHDDSARPRSWRKYQCDDVPFNECGIELRPIGSDGHIVLRNKNER